jgi:uncharacterized MAPEG superfamily protein
MKTELLYLVYVTVLTGLLWVPYILDRIATWGLTTAVGYPDNPPAQSAWARRLMKAHFNAVENLVVFAALVFAADALEVSNSAIASAAVIAYTFAIPWVRTLAFAVGFFAQAVIAWQILVR